MIRAIETAYDGRLFRSRAEARWAAFFKALGLVYEYEPEGVELSGRRYLPDFRLRLKNDGRLLSLWLEVKPAQWNDDGKMQEFANLLPADHRATVLPALETYLDIVQNFSDELQCWFGRNTTIDYETGFEVDGGYDVGYMFCKCPDCGAVGFEHCGRAARIGCCDQPTNAAGHPDKNYQFNSPLMMDAFRYALSERFGT